MHRVFGGLPPLRIERLASLLSLEMAFINGRGNQEALPRKIGPEAPSGDFPRLLIDLSCPHFDGEHGLQLHNRKVRDHGLRTRLLWDAVHVNGSVFLVVELRKCARVEKIAWQISALDGAQSRPRKGSRKLWRALV